MVLLLRTERDPLQLVDPLKKLVRGLEPNLAISELRTYEDLYRYHVVEGPGVAIKLAVLTAVFVLVFLAGERDIRETAEALRKQANAEQREVVCTVGGSLTAPVAVNEGDQVQLVLVEPVLGTRVNVGAAQTATPGTQVLSATVTGVIGLVGQLCRAAVQVQAVVTSAVPLPPVSLPTVPLLPSQSVPLPVPGVDVSVVTGGSSGAGGGEPVAGQPGSGQPPPAAPDGPSGYLPGYRFDQGRIPFYDFSAVPYGVGARFGAGAAPAFRFGQRLPGYAPQFGILGDDAASNVAGKVRALPLGRSASVALPVLLAVLMLSTVSGALVRTWALRRASPIGT